MAGKTNIRSIRFSDEIAELINQQDGKTFTEKFENLVTRCCLDLPRREEDLKKIQARINEERERLFRLQKATEQLKLLEQDLRSARNYFGLVERRAKSIAEAAEKEMM